MLNLIEPKIFNFCVPQKNNHNTNNNLGNNLGYIGIIYT